MMVLNRVDGVANDSSFGIGLEGSDQVQIVAHGGFVGAHLGPLVAGQADALRRE